MSARIASAHADHRRGLVLGLTMAEVLLLLLFLLLLALTSALATARKEEAAARADLERLGPVLAVLAAPGVPQAEAARQVAHKLAEAERARGEAEALRHEATALNTRLTSAEAQLQEWRKIAEEARRIDPGAAPAATLREALRRPSASQHPSLSEALVRSESLAGLEQRARSVNPSAWGRRRV
jgi:hypothetical protein